MCWQHETLLLAKTLIPNLALQTCHKRCDFACSRRLAKNSQPAAMIVNTASVELVQLERASRRDGQQKQSPFGIMHVMTYRATIPFPCQGRDMLAS